MTAPDPTEVLVDDDASDRLAVAYWTGRIDHRNQQPRRVDHADRGPIATAYHHGYDHNDNGGGEAAEDSGEPIHIQQARADDAALMKTLGVKRGNRG